MERTTERHGGRGGLQFATRAFGHRNYRLFFAGQGTSLIGTWMQQIAMSWLVYKLTGSPLLLGLIGFTGQAPLFFFTSFAGVLIDRWERRPLLLTTNILAMTHAITLAVLTLSGLIAVWHLFVLSFFLGLINAFDMPTRQSFVIDLVERKEDLNNAIALNSAMFNAARLIGPSLAGLTIAAVGEGICFTINGVSFLAIIAALAAMKITPKKKVASTMLHPLEGFREGYRYAFGFMPIRYCLMLMALLNFMGMQYVVLMPVFAKDVLHGGPHTLGFLIAASGTGALVAALLLASRKSVVDLERLVSVALGFFGCAILVFALSRNVTLSLAAMFFSGMGTMTVLAGGNTIIQSVVDEDKRGRVMSFHAMATLGTMPFGSLVAGSLASSFGAPRAVFVAGACCLLGSFYFIRRTPQLRAAARPIYVNHGLIKETPREA
jgi:MFS family permease